MDTLASFLPAALCKTELFSRLPLFPAHSPKQYLKLCGEDVFVDGPFEVHPVRINSVSMESIDAILVSNWMSLVALPFFTENTNFSGAVFATDPTLQLGRELFSTLPLFPAHSPKQYLKLCGEDVFVDGPFEVHPVRINSVSMESIDAILVSNWMSLVALPFFTENTNFSGAVFATDPTLQLGRSFPNAPSSDPREWTSFYSHEQMENCLAKVQRISFRESVVTNAHFSCHSI
ncbi:unnamed protein product [Gongylonema pulchrum]|uniref:Lactamase_B domain-containing protein n=1 Tax=Gongylonema pulchrum TaxID=637853 RepID=A0A183EER8_9BILA|nr:unnamed protein product [Gongylonema pulchrum]